jgi:hypothetical protein
MGSDALAGLQAGVAEVKALRQHYVVRRGHIPSGIEADAARAHGRASVVLLSSHWERYFRAVNEEAVAWLNSVGCSAAQLPLNLRLQHTRKEVDELGTMDWTRRENRLLDFASQEATLWTSSGTTGNLQHHRLLTWMKSPKPSEVIKFYELYDLNKIFHTVTRKPSTRGALFLNINELVEKRNFIAHGDATTQAPPTDITRYLGSVSSFAIAADKKLSSKLRSLAGTLANPW